MRWQLACVLCLMAPSVFAVQVRCAGNNTEDDTKALEDARDALPAGGGVIEIVSRACDLWTTFVINRDHVTLKGQGFAVELGAEDTGGRSIAGGTTLRKRSGLPWGIRVAANGVTLTNFYLRGGGMGTDTGNGIIVGDAADASFFTARQITVTHMGGNGLEIRDVRGVSNVNFASLDNVRLLSNGQYGLYLRGDKPNANAGSARMVVADANGSVGILVSGATSWHWEAIAATDNGTRFPQPGMRFDDYASFHTVINGNFENNRAVSGAQVEFRATTEQNLFVRFGMRADEVLNLNSPSNKMVLRPSQW